MTKDEFSTKVDSFMNKYYLKFLDADGVYGNQCVDVIKAYFTEVVGISGKARGNAINYWDNCPELDKIANTPSGVPQKGDVIVWNKDIGSQYGHIAIFKQGNSKNFESFDQNFPTGSKCNIVNHSYKGVIGWLRPKNINDTPAAPTIDQKDTKINELTSQIASMNNMIGALNGQIESDSKKIKEQSALLEGNLVHLDELNKKILDLQLTLTDKENTIQSLQKDTLSELTWGQLISIIYEKIRSRKVV